MPCLSGESSALARTLCPVHQVWPYIAAQASVRGFLFPTLPAGRFNKKLKKRMSVCQFTGGEKYPLTAFAEGLRRRSNWRKHQRALLKKPDAGTGLASGHTWTQMAGALKISRLLTKLTDSDIEDEEGVSGPLE